MRGIAILLSVLFITASCHADDWPQWLGPRRDGVWRETGLVEKFPSGGPKIAWRAPLGAGYSGPAVADGRVFVLDRVQAKDAKRSSNPFNNSAIKGEERILCFDEATGKEIWQHAYDCTYQMIYPLGPRCTPSVDNGKVYSLGAMGNLICLEAATGKVVWEVDLPKQFSIKPPGAGYAAHPLVDGQRLICMVGGQDSAVVAFDKETGKVLWRALSAPEAGYSPPWIATVGSGRQLIAWDPAQVAGLDPETGKVYWSEELRAQMNMNVVMPRLERDRLFLALYFQGATLLKLGTDNPTAEVLWKHKADRQTGLKCMNGTPFIKDGHVYGVCGNGELRCLKLETGERLWSTLKPVVATGRPLNHATAFLIPTGDRVFIFNESGELIIAKLSSAGYEEIDRAQVIAPTFSAGGRDVVWCHPAFANKRMYVRNDKEIICVDLAAE